MIKSMIKSMTAKKLYKTKKLMLCPVCGQMGYQYIRWRGKHQYIYTKHLNEPPIGTYSNNKPKYRECYDSGRLYNSFEEFTSKPKKSIKAITKKLEPEVPPKIVIKSTLKIPDTKATIKTYKKHRHHDPKIIVCPKCGLTGRVNKFHPNKNKPELIKYYLEHDKISGTWGKNKMTKRSRCYMTGKVLNEAVIKALANIINN